MTENNFTAIVKLPISTSVNASAAAELAMGPPSRPRVPMASASIFPASAMALASTLPPPIAPPAGRSPAAAGGREVVSTPDAPGAVAASSEAAR